MNGHNVSVRGVVGTTTGSTITSTTAAILTLNNSSTAISYAGGITGAVSLVKDGSGTQTLTGTNSYSGTTTVNAGTLAIGGTAALSQDAGNTVTMNGTGTLTYTAVAPATWNNSFLGAGNLTIPATAGSLTLNGISNGFTGTTTVGGTLVVGDATHGSAVLGGALIVQNGATLKGAGTVGALTLAKGSTLSPGNSPESIDSGAATWNGGSTYVWELNQVLAGGTIGSQDALQTTNFDFWNITGKLTISATEVDKIIINIASLAADNTPGSVQNWTPGDPGIGFYRSFTIATASAGIEGFDAKYFLLDDASFKLLNPYGIDNPAWSISQQGNSLVLTYVPEPGTLGLLALGALALLGRRKKNR
jgi:autotransporter-associated beta strand protein